MSTVGSAPATERDPERPSLPPTSLIDDALTHLSLIFHSSTPHDTNEPGLEGRVNDPSLILYCPIEGGEVIVDSSVHELARRVDATVRTIDIVQCIDEQPSSFWNDVGYEGSDPHSRVGDNASPGYFKIHEPINTTKLIKIVKKAISQPNSVPRPENHRASQNRIVYLRDFGSLVTFAPASYGKVLSAIQKPLPGAGDGEGIHPPTVVILGASPLLVQGGLFQKGASTTRSSRHSFYHPFYRHSRSPSPVSKPIPKPKPSDIWGEGKSAEKRREQRLREQHEMWRSGALTSHIHDQLAGVLSGNTGPDRKRIPTYVMVPAQRDLKQERSAREKRRLELNKFKVRMALLAAGSELSDATRSSDCEDKSNWTSLCKEQLVDYDVIKRVADRAITTALVSSLDSSQSAPTAISWNMYCSAWKAEEDLNQQRANWLKNSTPGRNEEPEDSNNSDDASATGDSDDLRNRGSGSKGGAKDPVVERVKSQSLNSYQRKMLGCLISPVDIQTGFDSVHLPGATIDAIRTLVSLRLVCPGEFTTGILKQYNMSGALLFGPPGTGKTHLVKAIAKESGARMISIKPSDILDKYVGEEEKIIDALFKLAQLLKPCIIFIDEIDALLGARQAAQSNNTPWRTDMLTQFTQEMDGMLSSDVIVIGASNRPFDLDDAIIRRLPCRILVDLPDRHAREAILRILLRDEQLELDVDILELASLTPNFSGSDLKHLCVTAAFESVKEMVDIPWAGKKGAESNSMVPDSDIPNPEQGEGSPRSPSLPNGASSQPNRKSQSRKLAKRHFTRALKQVRASTAETQTSLVELRRWNHQFGSNNRSSDLEDETEEDVIEWVRKQRLSSHQEKLLSCLIRPADIPTGFESVHLPHATIDAMRTLVSLRLVCPEAFQTGILKQHNLSGALLFGPPGTGKTHLVKAIAKESGARMISIKPSDILNKLVGEEEKTIDGLFKLAKLLKPCIVFIDEIDALLGARQAAKDNRTPWRTDMLTQFTQEMDGMISSDVIVIGASNRPFDLDDAIVRRLPCRILVDLPERDARKAILRILLKDELIERDVDIDDLASLTSNFSGSDLKHLCVTAAFESAKELANISWAEKRGSNSAAMLSSLGVVPVASESGVGNLPTTELTEDLTKASPMSNNDHNQPDDAADSRKLAKRHFTSALRQVRASTSETQSSLIELHRWNTQFGSGNQSGKSGAGYGVPGSNLPGSNHSRMSGTGVGGAGIWGSEVHSPGLHASGINGIGSGMNLPRMNAPGVNTPGTGSSEATPPDLGFLPPVEGSYLRSLGVKF